MADQKDNKSIPPVSTSMYKSVSDYRRQELHGEVNRGLFRDGSVSGPQDQDGTSRAGLVTASVGLTKSAQILSSTTTGSNYRGGTGESLNQSPEVYSPLWLNSNLNLPRDRATINAWNRSFYALNPMVQNAINLHSTYPISKLSIKCPNKKVEQFFNEMIEETDLMNVCVSVAQEYWLLGEAFIYAELDERHAKWSRFIVQNPDYIVVKKSVIASEPVIMLRPDENLRRIVFSNKPGDVEQRRQLHDTIISHVRRGENIPLDNFYVSHLARKISPYEVRGTGLPVCCFRQLMLFDKIREAKFAQADNLINPLTLVKIGSPDYKTTSTDLEIWRNIFECHDEETEVLTDQGFKKFDQVIEYQEVMDGTYSSPYIINVCPRSDIKIACFNPQNEQLEYHAPTNASLYDYDGEMYHFANEKVDIKVTPNHKMWVSDLEYEYHGHRSLRKTKWGEWKKIEAQDIKLTDTKRFRSQINWVGNDNIKSVDILGKEVPIELYLEFLGYLISEGCLYTNNKSSYTIGICQTTTKYYSQMKECVVKFAKIFNARVRHAFRPPTKNQKELWTGIIYSKDLYNYFKDQVGDSAGQVKAPFKCIPRWILELSPRLLNILLRALLDGDGSRYVNSKQDIHRFVYYTTSKQLSDDVYELVYKCGYVPITAIRDSEKYIDNRGVPLYMIMWSDSGKGQFPHIYTSSRNSQTKEKHDILHKEHYSGKVWCFEVPTGLFITRRNGKITIQGNSAQFDKDFKIFTHEAVTVERVGANSAIYDTSGDITQLLKEIYIGLMVPQVLMDGGGDVTYANGGVTLDVLRQRYLSFRNMMSTWLKRKIFQPISKLNDFYEYENGEKHLIIPEVDWNHMSLFDAGDYIQFLVQLSGETKKVSTQTLYRSLGLEYEDELRKIRKEDISDAIRKKEQVSLEKLPLNELRSLGEEDDIPEIASQPLPGEQSPYDAAGGAPSGGGLPGASQMDFGLPSSSPPSELPSAPPAGPPPVPTI